MSDRPSYAQMLLDPRWQRKRLIILARDGWLCVTCGCGDLTLHVHHAFYIYGFKPWDYEDSDLSTQCEKCHHKIHDPLIELQERVKWCNCSQCGEKIERVLCTGWDDLETPWCEACAMKAEEEGAFA